VNIKEIHRLFIAGEKLTVIAFKFGVSEGYIQQLISKERKSNPEKWPSRNKPKYFKQLFHVYKCEECILVFTVEQALEDQSNICCPQCGTEEINDAGAGEMIIRREE
jgi:DNA-directed RNA polymerase subunit RPC12/RpoP